MSHICCCSIYSCRWLHFNCINFDLKKKKKQIDKCFFSVFWINNVDVFVYSFGNNRFVVLYETTIKSCLLRLIYVYRVGLVFNVGCCKHKGNTANIHLSICRPTSHHCVIKCHRNITTPTYLNLQITIYLQFVA